MKITGQKLKEKREESHLTISEVSLATKINPKVLAAMEIGDLEHLPAKTFLRGFVRSYANFLKMNANEMLVIFNEEIGDGVPQVATEPSREEPPVSSSRTVNVDGDGSGIFRTIVVGGILFLIVLIVGVRSLIQKYERERLVDSTAEISTGKVTPLEKKEIEKPVDEVKPKPTNEDPAEADASSTIPLKIEAPLQAEPPHSVAMIPPEKTESPKPQLDPKPVDAESREAKQMGLPKPETKLPEKAQVQVAAKEKPADVVPVVNKASKKSRHEIILEALDNVEVRFSLQGENKKISLAPSQVHTIFADGPITLDVSDGGALNITDNGRDKGPAGDLGRPKQVSIP